MDLKPSVLNYLSHLSSRGVKYVPNIKVGQALTNTKDSADLSPGNKTVSSSDTKSTKPIEMKKPKSIYADCKYEDFKSLEDIKACIGECKRCRLCEARTKIVFGEGNPNTQLMFIGEGPGEDEDLSGRPFVGRAGQLLTKIIENGMKLKREDVYIANIVKCRPPANRTPVEDEIMTCFPFLMGQINVIKPKVIITLGSPATCTLLNEKIKISAIRGTFYDWKEGIKLMPTFHPAYLLRNYSDANRRYVWEDVQKVMEYLKQ